MSKQILESYFEKVAKDGITSYEVVCHAEEHVRQFLESSYLIKINRVSKIENFGDTSIFLGILTQKIAGIMAIGCAYAGMDETYSKLLLDTMLEGVSSEYKRIMKIRDKLSEKSDEIKEAGKEIIDMMDKYGDNTPSESDLEAVRKNINKIMANIET